MIKYVCVHEYPPHKKGDVVDVAPPGSGNAFVPKNVPEPLVAAVEAPASTFIKPSPQRSRITPSRQEPE